MSLKVHWTNPCHIDGIHGSYGFSETDDANNLGLRRWVLRFPCGKDGKSAALEEIVYTMDGVDGEMTHYELVARIKELGLWKTNSTKENDTNATSKSQVQMQRSDEASRMER